MAKMKEMAASKAGVNSVNQISELPGLEADLMKLIEMKEKGLISEVEYAKMREKRSELIDIVRLEWWKQWV